MGVRKGATIAALLIVDTPVDMVNYTDPLATHMSAWLN
jgi:hypothetical protein